MSLKSGLIFVCVFGPILATNIRIDDPMADMILRQTIAENSPDLHLVLQVSEMLYTVMGGTSLASENENSAAAPLWKSIVTTLSRPEAAETFKLAVPEIEKIINEEDARQSLVNIFAMLYTCLTHGVGRHGGIQLPLRTMALENGRRNAPTMEVKVEEMMQEPYTNEEFRIGANFGKDALNEALQEILSEEGDSKSQYWNAPRDLDQLDGRTKPREKDSDMAWVRSSKKRVSTSSNGEGDPIIFCD